MLIREFSNEEKLEILKKGSEAFERGDMNAYKKYAQMIPLAPHIAWAVKATMGKDFLKGWDLSEAEAQYGKNWLDR